MRELEGKVECLLVVGATNSSNSNRLRDLGEEIGISSYLIASAEELDLAWLEGKHAVGITAGASAPEHLVEELVSKLQNYKPSSLRTLMTVREDIQFKLPKELIDVA